MSETTARLMPYGEWLKWRRLMEKRARGGRNQSTIDDILSHRMADRNHVNSWEQ